MVNSCKTQQQNTKSHLSHKTMVCSKQERLLSSSPLINHPTGGFLSGGWVHSNSFSIASASGRLRFLVLEGEVRVQQRPACEVPHGARGVVPARQAPILATARARLNLVTSKGEPIPGLKSILGQKMRPRSRQVQLLGELLGLSNRGLNSLPPEGELSPGFE